MKNNKKISVFVVDDHPVARMGICESLKAAEDILLIGEAENGVDLKEIIQIVSFHQVHKLPCLLLYKLCCLLFEHLDFYR